MIDLTNLTPIADVFVKVASNGCSINIRFTTEPNALVLSNLMALKGIGCDVHRRINNQYCVFPNNYDRMQIAERISCYLESTGLTVKRLVSDPNSFDNSPKVDVQSFILA